jgi:16S rRNA U516 pseudouridylate synthase RsuA-like enzyme
VTSLKKDSNALCLKDWLPLEQLPPGIVPIGRLDKDTTGTRPLLAWLQSNFSTIPYEGLLLLTSDGDLNHAIRRKDNSIVKIYRLFINEEEITAEHPKVKQLLQGVDILDGGDPAKV